MYSYEGKTKKILKYLGFLVKEYNMQFKFQTFKNFGTFYGPFDYYSFYNEHGCYTIENAVQRGEWGMYKSKEVYDNPNSLTVYGIDERKYLKKGYFTSGGWLKAVAQTIKEQIQKEGAIWGISVTKNRQ